MHSAGDSHIIGGYGRADSGEGIFTLFQALVKEGKTIVMVTHDQRMSQRSTRTLHLVDGRLDA